MARIDLLKAYNEEDPEGGPLSDTDPRHEIVAHFVAMGYKIAQVQDILAKQGIQLSYNSLSVLRAKPRFKQRVREIQAEQLGKTTGGLLNRLLSEALPSVDEIVRIRDQAEDDAVRLRASDSLLDRAWDALGLKGGPQGSQSAPIPVLTEEQASRFSQALAEVSDLTRPLPAPAYPVEAKPELGLKAQAPAAPLIPRKRGEARTVAELRASLPAGEKPYDHAL